MNINNVNQLFQTKLTEINSRLPKDTNIKNKFNSIMEQAQLKSPLATEEKSEEKNSNSLLDNPTELLKNISATQSYLASTNALFSTDTNSNGLFPTSSLNNSINTLQQNLLLKALENKKEE